MRVPHGAQTLERIRRSGKRPLGPVVVTDNLDVANMARGTGAFAIVVEPGASELRCLGALDVFAVIVASDFLGILASIDAARPGRLCVFLGAAAVDFADMIVGIWRHQVGRVGGKNG